MLRARNLPRLPYLSLLGAHPSLHLHSSHPWSFTILKMTIPQLSNHFYPKTRFNPHSRWILPPALRDEFIPCPVFGTDLHHCEHYHVCSQTWHGYLRPTSFAPSSAHVRHMWSFPSHLPCVDHTSAHVNLTNTPAVNYVNSILLIVRTLSSLSRRFIPSCVLRCGCFYAPQLLLLSLQLNFRMSNMFNSELKKRGSRRHDKYHIDPYIRPGLDWKF